MKTLLIVLVLWCSVSFAVDPNAANKANARMYASPAFQAEIRAKLKAKDEYNAKNEKPVNGEKIRMWKINYNEGFLRVGGRLVKTSPDYLYIETNVDRKLTVVRYDRSNLSVGDTKYLAKVEK